MNQHSAIPRIPFRFKPQDSLPCEVVRLEQIHGSAWTYAPHRHHFYMIMWVTAGQGVHIIDFEPYPLISNTLFVLNPDQIQHWNVSIPPHGWAIMFTHDFLLYTLQEPTLLYELNIYYDISRQPALTLDTLQADKLQRAFSQIHAEYEGSLVGRESVIRSYLHILLIQIHRYYALVAGIQDTSPQVNVVRHYVQLVDQQFVTLQHVEAYAQQLAISVGHLSDLVRQKTGLTASGVIRRRIVLEAKRILAHTDWSIAQIALELGFNDPSYFGRFFRREVGETPGRFREKFREKYHAHPDKSLADDPISDYI